MVKVLDHGFVELLDFMGSDKMIAQRARVSTKSSSEDDEKLIRYLMRHRHTTPFEMVVFQFHCKMPIFVARQWVRHRMATINEVSARYTELPEEYYIPKLVMAQSTTNKQGTSQPIDAEIQSGFQNQYAEHMADGFEHYHNYLEEGVSREQARIVLSLSTYTEWIWKCDLHNLFHFLKLRLDTHAQWEIRQYAQAIADTVKHIVPIAYKAFEDYVLNAVTFTVNDLEALGQMLYSAHARDLDKLFPTDREYDEFITKLHSIKNPLEVKK